jgi:hypothetical protein
MTDPTEEQKMAELSALVRQLPRDIDPPADAWSSIKAEMQKGAPVASLDAVRRKPVLWQRPAFLAAAGLVLVAVSSFMTAAVMGWNDGITRVNRIPAVTAASHAASHESGPTTLAEFASVENDYISTANQLSAVLESEKSTLSPATVAKLKESLRIIDAAIVEARRALAADPANRALIDMLNTSYNQKLDLLKRTTEMGRS